MQQQHTKKLVHVNNTGLADKIIEFVDEIINNYSILWASGYQRDSVLDIIEYYFEDFAEQGLIDRWDIMCDARNNKPKDEHAGIVYLTVKYTQRDCFNDTEIRYTITNTNS